PLARSGRPAAAGRTADGRGSGTGAGLARARRLRHPARCRPRKSAARALIPQELSRPAGLPAMPHHPPRIEDLFLTRRELLQRSGLGFGMLGLAGLLAADGSLGAAPPSGPAALNPLAPKQPHFRPRAKQVVHLFMNGGPSHVDTFDPKPMLDKYHGKPLPNPNLRTERKTAGAMRSPFSFKRYGKSGIEVSELFDITASQHIDDLCVL